MFDIEKAVRSWDARMRSFPTFEEIRDVEYVRRSGRINMITENLQRELYDRKRFAGAVWIERCRENRVPWSSLYSDAVKLYTSERGDPDTWFPSELTTSWETDECESQIAELEEKLRRLKSRRAKGT